MFIQMKPTNLFQSKLPNLIHNTPTSKYNSKYSFPAPPNLPPSNYLCLKTMAKSSTYLVSLNFSGKKVTEEGE